MFHIAGAWAQNITDDVEHVHDDLQALIAAFERYEYIVRNIYNETEYTGEIKDRYDALMRYLNV